MPNILDEKSRLERAKAIKLLILDVDGVLSVPGFYIDDQGRESKQFHVRDGLGITLLRRADIHVAIISGRNSHATAQRAEELHVSHCLLGQKDKLPAYYQLKKAFQVEDHEIACMGDDLPDLPLLRRAGLAITFDDVAEVVQEHAHWCLPGHTAGNGAVRHVAEYLLVAQSRYESVIQSYLTS